MNLVEQESKLIEQRKINTRLEKDMEKIKLDLNNVKNRTGKIFFSFISSFFCQTSKLLFFEI